jgi:uncharacterized protein (DUF2141 family)
MFNGYHIFSSRNCAFLFLLIAFNELAAQPFTREVESIPVVAHSRPVALPWAGGINSPHFQFVDIDGDGDKDLFIIDHDNGGLPQVDFYRNEGTSSAPDFRVRPGIHALPAFTFWCIFLDITDDGLVDLFTDDGGTGMNFYKNTGTAQNPIFTLIASPVLDSAGNLVNAGSYSIPGFADVDGDGRIDFFSGNLVGSVNFYRNVGTPSSPSFRFITGEWQNILIVSGGPCGSTFRPDDPMHGASAYFFEDYDGDGDLDLFWGDLFANGIYFFRNQGTPQVPVMVLEDTNCFPSGDPVVTAGGNQPALVDIDGDGDMDFFVGVGAVSGAYVPRHGFLFYENVGSSTAPNLVKRTEDYISMIDVGRQAHPTFVDIDGNGSLDLYVGTTNGELWYFRNEGTPTFPSFVLVDSTTAGIAGGFSYAPEFVDIDNDGDMDLFLGMFDGTVKYFRNDGTPQNPVFVAAPSPVDTINVTYFASPTFVDIDGDGDQDLFIGRYDGTIRFYRNVGNSTSFLPILESIHFSDITAGQDAKPVFVDIDGDGDFDLFVGTSQGGVQFYENTGTPTSHEFVLRTTHFALTDPLRQAAPAFADIDGDGDPDLFLGTLTGGIHFYRNQRITSTPEADEMPRGFFLDQNYPNPFNPTTKIRFGVPQAGLVTLVVRDVLGREVLTLLSGVVSPGTYETELTASSLASGVYLYTLTLLPNQGGGVSPIQQTRKLVIVR